MAGTLASLRRRLARHAASRYAHAALQRQARGQQPGASASRNPRLALGLPRVYVLTGRRTCSASEQVINGLRGVGVDVVAIGDTTCGKPVGFLPSATPAARPTAWSTSRASTRATRAATSTASPRPARSPRTSAGRIGAHRRPPAGRPPRTMPTTVPARPARRARAAAVAAGRAAQALQRRRRRRAHGDGGTLNNPSPGYDPVMLSLRADRGL